MHVGTSDPSGRTRLEPDLAGVCRRNGPAPAGGFQGGLSWRTCTAWMAEGYHRAATGGNLGRPGLALPRGVPPGPGEGAAGWRLDIMMDAADLPSGSGGRRGPYMFSDLLDKN